jgi:hypothetical protein
MPFLAYYKHRIIVTRCKCAHICSLQEIDWFSSNGMARYNLNGFLSGTLLTDDSSNALTLCADPYSAFDKGYVCLCAEADFLAQSIRHPLQGCKESKNLNRGSDSLFESNRGSDSVRSQCSPLFNCQSSSQDFQVHLQIRPLSINAL